MGVVHTSTQIYFARNSSESSDSPKESSTSSKHSKKFDPQKAKLTLKLTVPIRRSSSWISSSSEESPKMELKSPANDKDASLSLSNEKSSSTNPSNQKSAFSSTPSDAYVTCPETQEDNSPDSAKTNSPNIPPNFPHSGIPLFRYFFPHLRRNLLRKHQFQSSHPKLRPYPLTHSPESPSNSPPQTPSRLLTKNPLSQETLKPPPISPRIPPRPKPTPRIDLPPTTNLLRLSLLQLACSIGKKYFRANMLKSSALFIRA